MTRQYVVSKVAVYTSMTGHWTVSGCFINATLYINQRCFQFIFGVDFLWFTILKDINSGGLKSVDNGLTISQAQCADLFSYWNMKKYVVC